MIETRDIEGNRSTAVRVEAVRQRITLATQRSGRNSAEITLIGVSKTVGAEQIRLAALAGLSDMGENRVQDAVEKMSVLGPLTGLHWHLIGRLQRNKVRRAVEIFGTIHSIDSIELATAISHAAESLPGPLDVFAQVNISGEHTKAGFSKADAVSVAPALAALPHLRWRGLMTIAPQIVDERALRKVFSDTRSLHLDLATTFDRASWDSLSMGMSGDFELAIEEGATHIRVGRAIFGERTLETRG